MDCRKVERIKRAKRYREGMEGPLKDVLIESDKLNEVEQHLNIAAA